MRFTILYCILLFLNYGCSPRLLVQQEILFDLEGNVTYSDKYIRVKDYEKLVFRDTTTNIRYSLDSTSEIVTAKTKNGDKLWEINPFKELKDSGWIDNTHEDAKQILEVRFLIHKPRLNYSSNIPVLYVRSARHPVYAYIDLTKGKCYFDRQY